MANHHSPRTGRKSLLRITSAGFVLGAILSLLTGAFLQSAILAALAFGMGIEATGLAERSRAAKWLTFISTTMAALLSIVYVYTAYS